MNTETLSLELLRDAVNELIRRGYGKNKVKVSYDGSEEDFTLDVLIPDLEKPVK